MVARSLLALVLGIASVVTAFAGLLQHDTRLSTVGVVCGLAGMLLISANRRALRRGRH